MTRLDVVNPKALGPPKGFNHGIVATGGRLLFVAGQPGHDASAARPAPAFPDQFANALDRVLAVVREAGGAPGDVVRMTVYVTHLEDYRAHREALGAAWRERFGRHYPAMALVEVKGLVDEGAVIEIEATASLGGGA